MWGAIKAFFETLWNGIKTVVQGAINFVNAVGTVINGNRDTWNAVWGGIKSFFTGIWDGIKGAFEAAIDWVKEKAEGFINFWKELPGKIGNFFKGMWDGLKDGFKAAINFIIGIWNRVADGLSFSVPDWVPGIGGKKFGLPHIPELASGGLVTRTGMALVGEKGPEMFGPAGGCWRSSVAARRRWRQRHRQRHRAGARQGGEGPGRRDLRSHA